MTETKAPSGDAIHSCSSSELFRGRWAVRFITFLTGAMAMMSLALFVFQFQFSAAELYYPQTMFRDTPGAWLHLSGHLLRGGLCIWLYVRLVQYLRELRKIERQSQPDYAPLFSATARGWCTLSWCVTAMLGYATVVFVDRIYDFSNVIPWRHDTVRFKPSNDREMTTVEFREADDEPQEDFAEYKMTVKEPVSKSIFVRREAIIETVDIARAKMDVDYEGGAAIALNLTPSGAKKLRAATTSLIGRKIAILIDDEVLVACKVNSPLAESVLVEGHFTRERAQYLVDLINGNH